MVNKHKLLGALFAEAAKRGIAQETLRDDIAPAIIGKRLSAASVQEVARIVDHITGRSSGLNGLNGLNGSNGLNRKRYESSKQGLIQEIRDIARDRFGDDYAAPLNAFCARFGEPDGFRKMRVSQMKIVKQRLKELQKSDPRGM
ncbi:MAG TPA: hypothetical protein ACFYEK_09010 [Candidatus Wunengus sp. YC60]|uniref:hypothetical protein n=1 Tax=Candidatus Wunengus sp. YC60 TaxID=3367697 RepID=UPI0040277EE8